MPPPLELDGQLHVVVDLAVAHWLVAGRRQVNDRKAAMAQAEWPVGVEAGVVRTAMGHDVAQAAQEIGIDRRPVQIVLRENPAHWHVCKRKNDAVARSSQARPWMAP